jgi:adenylyl-sulfate reductase (glutathione)
MTPETYQLSNAVEKACNTRIKYTVPDGHDVLDLVRDTGLFYFYVDGLLALA